MSEDKHASPNHATDSAAVGGFRFPSPFPQDTTDAFARFRSALSAGECYNAWPKLADARRPDLAWSHPLLRCWYLPVVAYAAGGATRFRYQQSAVPVRVALLHEMVHAIFLETTPAKLIARITYASAMHALDGLLEANSPSWGPSTDDRWTDLREYARTLTTIAGNITLAEELLATSVSFASMRRASPQEGPTLSELEQRWVTQLATTLEMDHAYFYALYEAFNTIAGIIICRGDTTRSAIARLGAFLEQASVDLATLHSARRLRQGGPIDPDMRMPGVNDSATFCEQLAMAAKTMGDFPSLMKWVGQRTRASAANRRWLQLWSLPTEEDSSQPYGRYRDTVAGLSPQPTVTRLGKWAEEALEAARGAWPWFAARTAALAPTSTLLTPIHFGGAWYVFPAAVISTATNQTESPELTQYLGALLLDAFRQQLEARKGVRCPLYALSLGSRGCLCKTRPWLRESVLRLAAWAKEGRFGEGDWSDVPGPCGQG